MKDKQLTLDLWATPQPEPETPFAGLTGVALDEAWRKAGCPLPVPHNCIPF